MTAQIQRAELGEREPGLEAFEDLAVDSPPRAAVLVAFVVEGEAGFLERREIPANRARGDFQLAGERVNRRAVARGFECVQDAPLPDDLLVPGHGSSVIAGYLAFFEAAQLAAPPAIGRAGGAGGGAIGALDASGFDFLWRGLRRRVVVQRAGFRLLDVLFDARCGR